MAHASRSLLFVVVVMQDSIKQKRLDYKFMEFSEVSPQYCCDRSRTSDIWRRELKIDSYLSMKFFYTDGEVSPRWLEHLLTIILLLFCNFERQLV